MRPRTPKNEHHAETRDHWSMTKVLIAVFLMFFIGTILFLALFERYAPNLGDEEVHRSSTIAVGGSSPQ